MRLLKFIATSAISLIAVVGYSQRQDSTSRMQYSVPSWSDPKKPPFNYTIVKQPERAKNAYSQRERIIVQLKGASGRRTSSGRIAISRELEEQQQQFINDLQRIDSRAKGGRTNATPSEIRHQYKRVFNGFAISTTKGIREEIERLDYVADVFEDKEVRVSDLQSSSIISAPKVWNDLGVTGEGITIGIIDTGIDYNHPDLGSGFGATFKVIGGYDFVNNDSDPIDDHGHGTHVAGIAAANGNGLKGVAPNAKLVAYKVLSAQGFGDDSGILAAIERSVDPDQNPNTSDALDVVNMSLGRQPDPLEPTSAAVNNAVAMGVTFVVAAGNNYDYFTVGTPGISEDAITVGATDNFDNTASFSSKGPTERNFAIKPDVTAPGVDIYSSINGGSYAAMSGTSMASPHVAGAVALILEKHPDWTPEIIKAALMATTKRSFDTFWAQGSGRIDVFDAINADFVVTPGSFSIGAPNKQAPTWTRTIKAKVYNLSATSRTFNMSVEGFSDGAIMTNITPSSFSLGANSSTEVDVTVTVLTSSLAVRNLPDAYSGFIVTESSSKQVKSPIAMVNPQVTTINIDGELPEFIVALGIEGSWFFKFYFPTSNEVKMFLPLGKYDFIAQFKGNAKVVTEGVYTEGDKTLTISKSQATNRVLFKPLDKNGNPIPIDSATYGTALFTGNERNFMTFYFYPEDTFYVNNVQHYRFDMRMHGYIPGDIQHYYEVTATTGTGVSSDRTASNDPAKFFTLNVTNPSAKQQQGLHYHAIGGSLTTWNNYAIPISNPVKILTTQTTPDTQMNRAYARFVTADNLPSYSWETGVWKASNENTFYFQDKIGMPITEYHNVTSFDLKLGESLPRFAAETSNTSDRVMVMDFYYNGIFNRFHGERERGTVNYKIYRDEALITEGYIGNNTSFDIGDQMLQRETPADQYRIELTYNDYQVQGKFGEARIDLHFDTSKDDKNPPLIKSLKFEVNGKSTNQLLAGEAGKIKFTVSDGCWDPFGGMCNSTFIKSVSTKIRKQGSTDWTTLTQTNSDLSYEAVVPANLSAGYYEVKIEVTDAVDNKLVHNLNPGFLAGNATSSTPYVTVTLIDPRNRAQNTGIKPLFRWSSLPTATAYQLQVSATPNFDGTLAADISRTSTSYRLTTSLDQNRTYYWRVKATTSNGTYWSVINSFFTGALEPTILVEPAYNESSVPTVDAAFKWRSMLGATFYQVDISVREDAVFPVWTLYTSDTTGIAPSLDGNKTYYWIVYTYYSDFGFGIPSATGKFSTGINTGVEDERSQRKFFNYPNPFAGETRFVVNPENIGTHSLSIVDAMGKEVRRLAVKIASLNPHHIPWDGKDGDGKLVSDGIYFVQLRTPHGVKNLKVLVRR